MRIFDYDYWPKYDVVSDYFTNSTLATDANMTLYSQLNAVWPYHPKSPVFEMYSEKVAKDLKKDNLYDYTYYLVEILNNDVAVLIYAGEFDG